MGLAETGSLLPWKEASQLRGQDRAHKHCFEHDEERWMGYLWGDRGYV